MENKSPLRYPGGKSRACKIIEETLLQHTDISQYKTLLSPFFGGGSFEFHLQNKYGLKIIANDKFKPLYTFWKVLKEKGNQLVESVREFKPMTKEKFVDYRDKIMDLEDELLQASYYFVINRCSFSGSTLSGGYSNEASNKRFTENSIKSLQNINLKKVKFYHYDFSKFIQKKHCQDAIIFLDPPYFLDNSRLYGNNGDMHEHFDHQKLADTLKLYNNWILCYNDCPYIRNLYQDYEIITLDWKYGMNKTKKSSELLILNFD